MTTIDPSSEEGRYVASLVDGPPIGTAPDGSGGYLVEAWAGEGGFSIVLQGVVVDYPTTKVALKILRPDKAPPELFESLKRNERRFRFKANHANVLRVYDDFVLRGTPWDDLGDAHVIVSEWAEETLLSLLDKARAEDEPAERGRLQKRCRDLVYGAGRGLAWCHTNTIDGEAAPTPHGDVSDSNLFEVDRVGKIGDFGLTYELTGGATHRYEPFLTRRHAAPERVPYYDEHGELHLGQMRLEGDVYSFGTCLYEALTLRPYRPGESSVTSAGLPREAEAVLRKMLAQAYAERYPNMAVVMDELDKLDRKARSRTGESTARPPTTAKTARVPAPPPSPPAPPKKHRWAIALAAVVLVVGIVLAIDQPWKSAPPALSTGTTTTASTTTTTAAPTTTTTIPPVPALGSGSWHFSPVSVSAGQSPSVSYDVGPLPPGDQLVAQRETGNGTTGNSDSSTGDSGSGSNPQWETVATLQDSQQSAALPSIPQGLFTYRLAVVNTSGRALSESAPQTIGAYAPVSFNTFLDDLGSYGGSQSFSTDDESSGQTGGQVFTWTDRYANNGTDVDLASVPATSTCNQIDVQIGMVTNGGSLGVNDTVTFLQSGPQQTVTVVPNGGIVTLQSSISPGAWGLSSNDQGNWALDFAGALSCYTANGAPPGHSN